MQKELEFINRRNRRVEADKAWETSIFRRSVIAILTYFIVAIFLIMINAPYPWLAALVPTAGFVLSTMTLKFLKRVWLKRFYRR